MGKILFQLYSLMLDEGCMRKGVVLLAVPEASGSELHNYVVVVSEYSEK